MVELSARVRAAVALSVSSARESSGLHDYDGVVPDLSDTGVAAAVAQLGQGPEPANRHDRAHLAAAEDALRLQFGALRLHHRDPLVHLDALDVSCYDRPYAPAAQRQAARRSHLARWPEAVDTAVATLDQVPAPIARALLPAARGLAAGVDDDAALRAQRRLVAHLEGLAATGTPDCAVGAAELEARYGVGEALAVTVGELAELAEAETARLTGLLRDACARLAGSGADVAETTARLLADHPDRPEDIHAEARNWVARARAFTVEHDLVADPGEDLVVENAPPSRSWAMAMMAWSGPYEADTPSCYWVTPPDPHWPMHEQDEWLAVFSRTTLPAITVHEVTPGHFTHGRCLRAVTSEVRRCLLSGGFIEGWAHDAEELLLEEGFGGDDPLEAARYQAGVALEALVRAVRLAASVGLHTGALSVEEAAARFRRDALMTGSAARSEAQRGTFDVTYGHYTWGKSVIRATRDRARQRWGSGFRHRRFSDALMALGAPPLGLLDDIFDPTGPAAPGHLAGPPGNSLEGGLGPT